MASNGLNFAEIMEEFEGGTGSGAQGGVGNYLDNFVLMPKDDGVVVIRILPPGNDLPMLHGGLCMSTRIHTVNNRKVHCRREKVKGQKYPVGDCRICDHYNWLYRKSDELKAKGDKEGSEACVREARAIKPVERYYFNAIVRKVRKENGEDEFNVGPKILSIGKTLKDRIFRAILGDDKIPDAPEAPLGDITHPINGRDLRIVKEMRHSNGESFPNYDKSKFTDPTPLGTPDQVKNWMGNLHDLNALRIVKTFEEVEREIRIHLGAEEDVKTSSYDPNSYSQVATPVLHNREVEDVVISRVDNSVPAGGLAPTSEVLDAFNKSRAKIDDTPNVAMNNDDFFATLKSL